VQHELRRGQLDGPHLSAGRSQDRASALQHAVLPAGSLRLADLGFFTLGVLRQIDAAGSFWLSRLRADVVVCDTDDQRQDDLGRWLAGQTGVDGMVDTTVTLGVRARLPARLVAWRVPQAVADERRRRLRRTAHKQGRQVRQAALERCAWTILVTNVPAERLSPTELGIVLRARWQIELVFKLWKQHGALDVSRSQQPWRIVCEVYAKLVALIIQHWFIVASGWAAPDKSLVKMAQAIRDRIILVAVDLDRRAALRRALDRLAQHLAATCRLNRRQQHPNAYQLWLDPSLGAVS
jgi:hypothetical protein